MVGGLLVPGGTFSNFFTWSRALPTMVGFNTSRDMQRGSFGFEVQYG
jgi:hypothetical protein